MKKFASSLLISIFLASSAFAADPVVLRFATVGDSRQDPKEFDPSVAPLSMQDKIWLQNTKAFSRMLKEIAKKKSRILFFNGDMIMGYGKAGPTPGTSVDEVVNSDLMAFYRQYGFWRGMVATLMESGTYVVPVAGNHEVQHKAAGKKAVVENENAWRMNMGDLIIDADRFKRLVGTAATHVNVQDNSARDGLTTDQSMLSYSFDVNDNHFAIINTDPVGADNTAPAAWLDEDMRQAKERGARHFFVFGHKPAFTYDFHKDISASKEAAGIDKFPEQRDAFWKVIENYQATYFCGHQHEYELSQPQGHAWQVLVGAGGSPWEAHLGEATAHPETDRMYAWAVVDVHKSGKVEINTYGFDEHFHSTRKLAQIKLAR